MKIKLLSFLLFVLVASNLYSVLVHDSEIFLEGDIEPLLINAIRANDLERVEDLFSIKNLLNRNVNIGIKNGGPLGAALSNYNNIIIRTTEPSLNENLSKDELTKLKSNAVHILEILFSNGFDADGPILYSRIYLTPLEFALAKKNLMLFEFLLKHGAHPNKKNESGQSVSKVLDYMKSQGRVFSQGPSVEEYLQAIERYSKKS